jgi:chromosomal replication initiator protein
LEPEEIKTWFQPVSYVRHTTDCLTIRVPNKLFSSVIRERYYDHISDAVAEICEAGTAIEILDGEEQEAPTAAPATASAANPALNPRYTFDSFVVGKSNELAHAAARAVAEHPGRRYNPLFLYGGVGLGKTHLMQAVGDSIIRSVNGHRVVYTSSETFMNELINSIRYDRTFQFREMYRSIDVLLIDDIQFIANKERTQEEFFHTFNALYNTRKQIIISSDRPPREIPALEERLRSRFEWGLIADIQPPELETKIAILHKKAEEEGAMVPEDVVMLIAGRVSNNIRELEGCLIRLVFYSHLTGRPINLALAQEALSDLLEPREKVVTLQQIQKLVANHYNITTRELTSKGNAPRVAFPRQVAMFLCKQLTAASLPEIGRQFGGKHHSTVIHSINKIENMRREDDSFSSVINNLISSIT